jgi:hypothetical protein
MKKLFFAFSLMILGSASAFAAAPAPTGLEFKPARISYDSTSQSYTITTDELGTVPLLIQDAFADVRLINLHKTNAGADYACKVQGSTTSIVGTKVFVLYALKECNFVR